MILPMLEHRIRLRLADPVLPRTCSTAQYCTVLHSVPHGRVTARLNIPEEGREIRRWECCGKVLRPTFRSSLERKWLRILTVTQGPVHVQYSTLIE